MRVARYYLDQSLQRLTGRESIQQRAVSDRIQPGIAPTSDDYEGLFLSADLASAAVRMWTIEERTDKSHYAKVEGYFGGADVPTEDILNHALNGAWLHGMMRDNIGHIETHGVTGVADWKVRMQNRRMDRLRTLGSLTFGQVYNSLRRTAGILEKRIDLLIGVPMQRGDSRA